MSFQHVNRRGDVYYLQSKERKGGAVGYSFTRKPTGTLVEQFPDGYELYEDPASAQVFIRKFRPSAILPEEKEWVESTLRRLTKLSHFIVNIEDKSLVVYTSDADEDLRLNLMRSIVPMDERAQASTREFMTRMAKYQKMMRFNLADVKQRLFTVERWCFRGSVDNWIYLKGNQPLAELAETYLPHIDQESFFDLMGF